MQKVLRRPPNSTLRLLYEKGSENSWILIVEVEQLALCETASRNVLVASHIPKIWYINIAICTCVTRKGTEGLEKNTDSHEGVRVVI